MVSLGTRFQKSFATLTLGTSLNESLLSAISYTVFINKEFLVGTYNYCCYKRGRRPRFLCQRVVFIFVWTIRTASR
jgi:tryptophan-rich sensory protein